MLLEAWPTHSARFGSHQTPGCRRDHYCSSTTGRQPSAFAPTGTCRCCNPACREGGGRAAWVVGSRPRTRQLRGRRLADAAQACGMPQAQVQRGACRQRAHNAGVEFEEAPAVQHANLFQCLGNLGRFVAGDENRAVGEDRVGDGAGGNLRVEWVLAARSGLMGTSKDAWAERRQARVDS